MPVRNDFAMGTESHLHNRPHCDMGLTHSQLPIRGFAVKVNAVPNCASDFRGRWALPITERYINAPTSAEPHLQEYPGLARRVGSSKNISCNLFHRAHACQIQHEPFHQPPTVALDALCARDQRPEPISTSETIDTCTRQTGI